MIRNNVVFRCDGAPHIGLGHVMRCLSLADGLRREGFAHITFMSKDYDERILSKIREYGFEVETIPHRADPDEDLSRLIEIARRSDSPVVITDSYDIDAHYLKKLKEERVILVSIDDLAQIHFPSDVVLNQNIYALEMNYSAESYTKLLLGQKYALLRREFLERRSARRMVEKKGGSVLVTMGGGDQDNQTLRVAEALGELDGSEGDGLVIHLVVGVGYQYHQQLCTASIAKNLRVNILQDPETLPQLMAQADLAVSAGGSTCYELACLGVPFITMSLADNQKRIAERLSEEEITEYLGYYQEVDTEDIMRAVEGLMGNYEKRKEMSTKGMQLVDGQGVERVVGEITSLLGKYHDNRKRV